MFVILLAVWCEYFYSDLSNWIWTLVPLRTSISLDFSIQINTIHIQMAPTGLIYSLEWKHEKCPSEISLQQKNVVVTYLGVCFLDLIYSAYLKSLCIPINLANMFIYIESYSHCLVNNTPKNTLFFCAWSFP